MKLHQHGLLATALFVGASLPLSAQAEYGFETPYVGIMGTYFHPDDDRNVHDALGAQVLFGLGLTRHLNLEFQTGFQNLERKGPGEDFRANFDVDLLLFFNPEGFTPFFIVGVGGAQQDVALASEDGVRFSANAGAGLMTPPLGAYGLRLRADARYIYDDFRDGTSDAALNLGLVVPFRKPKTIEVVKTEIREVPVVKEVPVVREVPVQPPRRDSDGDGVYDDADFCPDTLPNSKVDQHGCVVTQAVVRLAGVNFEFDSAALTDEAQRILDGAVRALQGQPGMTIEVAGHTDSVGAAPYNQRLSERRARSVVQYLMNAGVDASLEAVGYGETQPVESNKTAEGRALNRRVEFRVLARAPRR